MAAPVFESGHYHWHLQSISRSNDHAMTAASAYRTGSVIIDDRTGTKHDYRARDGVTHTQLVFPAGVKVPASFTDGSTVWNAQERREKRCDSIVGREVNIGLPHQLSPEGRLRAGLRMAQLIADTYRVAAEIAFHDASNKPGHDERNVHVHILFSSRQITPEGFGEKTVILDKKNTSSGEVKFLRQAWQDIANEELEREGINVRIDCRSLKDQGITDRLPQIHEGVKVRAMLDRGVDPAEIDKLQRNNKPETKIDYEKVDEGRNRADFNAEIIDLNDRRAQQGPLPLAAQIRYLERLIEVLLEQITDLESLIPRALLPLWVRLKIERAWLKAVALMQMLALDKEEAEKRREVREGIHAHMKRMKEELRQLEKEKAHKQALQRLYMRIEAQVVMTRPATVIIAMPRPPPRELTNEQYSMELKYKAETARARVPPEYRPRLPVKDVVWDVDREANSLGRHFQNVVPIDNGGRAKAPPSITINFNEAANPPPERSYKARVSIGFA